MMYQLHSTSLVCYEHIVPAHVSHACRYLGLDCHLLLRTSRRLVDEDPGLVGNLLPGRLVGATLHLVRQRCTL